MNDLDLTRRLKESLRFRTLEEAEGSLRIIQGLLAECRRRGDHAGAEQCRERVREGKRRLLQLSRNRRIDPGKRRQKEEMLNWFRLWLDSPENFFPWLEVRKQTREFREIAALVPPVTDSD